MYHIDQTLLYLEYQKSVADAAKIESVFFWSSNLEKMLEIEECYSRMKNEGT